MFESERQRLAVCATLLHPFGLVERGYWSREAGPLAPTWDLVEGRGCALSSGEQIVLRVAVDLYNGRGLVKVADVAGRLDEPNLRRIGSLFVAMADGRVEEWLELTEARLRNDGSAHAIALRQGERP
ncbi:MAG TPA: hypothetical protein VGI39_04965 [Polyangiaceae bacterium]|jgi:hypothetical protein